MIPLFKSVTIVFNFCLVKNKYIIATGIWAMAIATKKLNEDVSSIIPFVKVSERPIETAVKRGIITEKFFNFFSLNSKSKAVNIVPIIVINTNKICTKVNLSLFIKNENNNVYTGYVAIKTVETLKLPLDRA